MAQTEYNSTNESVGKVDPVGTEQHSKIWPCWQIIKGDLVFKILRNQQITTRRLDLRLIKKKKITCHLIEFQVPVNHRVKKKN